MLTRCPLQEHVSFLINAPYSTILEHLSTASIGLSTMVDEHFGINVVEFMVGCSSVEVIKCASHSSALSFDQAAGLITLSHASAGPLLDIAVPAPSGQVTGASSACSF
jgi:alpha-1,2-mannosyltransferase